MSIQPNRPATVSNKKTSSGFTTTIILVLLIAITVMGIMTAKRYLEAQQSTPAQREIKGYTEFVNKNPDNITGRLNLAFAFQEAKRYDEAREQYQEVLKVSPKEQGALYNLGEIARINEDFKEAESWLTQLLEEHKTHLLGSISLGQVYLDSKQYDKAIEAVDKMLEITPHIADLHFIKAQAYGHKGDKVKAKASYQQVLKYDPTHEPSKKALTDLK